MEIKAGDYLLTKEKQLFRITDMYYDPTGTFYDIKTVKSLKESNTYSTSYLLDNIPRTIRAVPRNVLRHMGKIIPEEKMTKIVKILYG